MAADLIKAIERVHLHSNDPEIENDGNASHTLQNIRSPQRVRSDPEQIKAQLEKEYLNPSTTFSTEWLNKLQQQVI